MSPSAPSEAGAPSAPRTLAASSSAIAGSLGGAPAATSAHASLGALDALGDAAALLDAADGSVLERTAAFAERVPDAVAGGALGRLEKRCPGIGAAFARARGGASHALDGDDGAGALAAVRLGDAVLVRLTTGGSAATARPDVHDYLRARDDLFSRSRTISVSEMATTLAHEINQPVGAIVNLLRGTRRRLETGDATPATLERVAPALEQALEQALYTSSVIARIRDFTRSRRPAREPIDVAALVRRSLALLDWMLEGEGCRVETDFPDVSTRLVGDETMLQQVLVNLVRNAAEAMRTTPRDARLVRVEARLDGERLTLSVTDRGEGLGNAEADLFVPFATSKPDGTGVGLNICRSFVELHGGRLWLAPNVDGGCTARIELPLGEREEPS